MSQLQSHHHPVDHAHKTKTLICALNLISRNLPLPPDLLDTVSSIYHDAEDAENSAHVSQVGNGDGSDEKSVDVGAQKGLVCVLWIPFF